MAIRVQTPELTKNGSLVNVLIVSVLPCTNHKATVFSDSQAVIKSLSDFMNNSMIVRECRRCLDLLSGRFTSVLLHGGRILQR